jgi:protein ImuB
MTDPMADGANLYACLYAKEFPAQALLRLRPDLCHHPCVVMEGKAPSQRVCSRTSRARAMGIECGMTKVEIETFPAVTILTRSTAEENSARSALLECAGTFSPRVEHGSNDHDFLCVIDIAGTDALFGPSRQLAETLLLRVRALGITANIAVSSNFHTAICVARGLPPGIQISVIPPGKEAVRLAPLPLTVLDLSEEQAERFAQWGIHTLGMLAALPEKSLVARMGQEAKLLSESAKGIRPHLFLPVESSFKLEEHMELESPVELLTSLLFVIGVMLDQLVLRATAHVVALASVTVTFLLEGDSSYMRTVRPALPSNDRQLWIKLIHLDLEAHPPQAAILALTLAAEPGSTNKVQLGLFSPQQPEASRLDVTLARVRSIVGENNVGRAVLNDTHQPDSFRVVPFEVPPETATRAEIGFRQVRAALRQLRPPEKTNVTMREQQPVAFYFREKHYGVEHAYGPWLSNGDWWNPTLWGFEQWDVVARSRDGVLLYGCLVRDLIQNCWQMAGLYD